MPAVQFYGVNEVLKAAENRDCPQWGIFQGKQFLFKYEEIDQVESLTFLQEILKALQRSDAIYTIKFTNRKIKKRSR
jgi:hypothetical protein